jgi:hypothetical protein
MSDAAVLVEPCSHHAPRRPEDGDVQLPYGLGPDGRLKHISEVQSGLKCGCTCPNPKCKARLVANKGDPKKKAHHFAHERDKSCKAAYESMLHLLGKEIIADKRFLWLPEVVATHGEMTKRVRPPVKFRVDTVTLEEWKKGRRPDIVARRTVGTDVKELLVEIFVTSRSDDEKIAWLRERKLPTVEIDLSRLPRDASRAEIEDAVLRSAPRVWLYNRLIEESEAEMRSVAEREARKRAAAFRARAERLASDYSSAMGQPRQHASDELRRFAATLVEAGLGTKIGANLDGSACFAVEDRAWQAALFGDFILSARYWMPFTSIDAVNFVRKIGLVRREFASIVTPELEAEARKFCPAFRAPLTVVDAYLCVLSGRGFLYRQTRGWRCGQGAHSAKESIEEVGRKRARISELRTFMRRLLGRLPDGRATNLDHWMRSRHEGIAGTPEEIATKGGSAFGGLLRHLGRLEAMFEPNAPIEEALLDLPMEAELRARRKEATESEEARRRREEEQKRLADDMAKLAAAGLKAEVLAEANRRLGPEAAARLAAQPMSWLGGLSLAACNGLSAQQGGLAHRAVHDEWERSYAETQRQSAMTLKRDEFFGEISGFGPTDEINFWFRSSNKDLDGRRPMDACVTEDGLKACRKAFGSFRRDRRW